MRRIKQKLQSKEAKEATYTAIGGLQRALDLFSKVAGNVGVPGLQKGVSGLSTVLAMIQVCAAYRISSTDAHIMVRDRIRTLKQSRT